ncbi:helix-turn-helix domain-containing protein [Piscinibacter koreensis]|uniref:Helix-turn-helix transcriptional regulator n=1 Tax=Piscinibacter koreensis TaxID=2742824 RepID=A0A7Y6TUT6_9BURK|nr:helix-turn-helix transcriptional regulator [Schlegelella koreensis]NUZ04202.1 helix-turn-helix transcriptional regulator [Schlegelella koreensis]
MIPSATAPVGTQLRQWRVRRQLSQLELALQADVSTRHLSYLETGRSMPSREMILRLANRLDVPLRERNRLLTSAGFAPMYGARSLDSPALAAARQVIERLLDAHEPYPALAVDREWNVVMQNRAVGLLLGGVAPELLQPPVNALRLSLHPDGLAPRIVNLGAWRAHVLARLAQQATASADPVLHALREELAAYPGPDEPLHAPGGEPPIVVPLVLDTSGGRLSFISTTTVFGTPVDVTLAELALETFFPADAETAAALRRAFDAAAQAGQDA